MRYLAIALLLAAAAVAPGPVLAGKEEKKADLAEIERQRDDLRSRLVAQATRSGDRTARRTAVARLQGGFSDDPGLGRRTARHHRRRPDQRQRRAAQARGTDQHPVPSGRHQRRAWTPDLAERGARVEAAYAASSMVIGTQERKLLQEYSQRLADVLGTGSIYGTVQEAEAIRAKYTDVDIFICGAVAEDLAFASRVRAFAATLGNHRFGRVRLRRADRDLMAANDATRGATTIVTDAGTPEEKDAERLAELFAPPSFRRSAGPATPARRATGTSAPSSAPPQRRSRPTKGRPP